MILEDYHTHNELCHHATGTIEDYVKSGIAYGLDTIGLNDHFPYEFLVNIENVPHKEYAMTLKEINYYLSTAKSLREKYKEQIAIKIGFEVEFIQNQIDSLNVHFNKVKPELDFIYGSIHVLDSKRGLWPMDDDRFIKIFDSLGADEVFLQYYKLKRKMVSAKDFDFDIVSHFDLPKKYNKKPNNKEQFINEVSKTLELIKKRDLTMEVNTSGYRKPCKDQYPSEEIIKMMHELDIPILLGSDAHAPKEVGWEFKKMISILKNIGFNQLVSFSKRKRSIIEI